MSQEYIPVEWVDETENQVGTVLNKARLDQMQTAHHFADGFKEVDTVPTADPGVDYHMVVFCTADTTFYRWNGTQWVKDVDDSTLALLEAHEADHNNPHVVTKAQVGLGNVDNKASVSTWQTTPDNDHIPTEKLVKDSLDAKVDDSQIVTAFQGTPDNTHIASEKLTKDSLDLKINTSALVSTWQTTPDNDHIPTEKLVKDSLDGKVDKLVTKPTAGTYTKLTINAEGQVTGGANPTTLAGYGITDAVTLNTAQTITATKTYKQPILLQADNTDPYVFITSNFPRYTGKNPNNLASADGMVLQILGYDSRDKLMIQQDGYRRGSGAITEFHTYVRAENNVVGDLAAYAKDNGTCFAKAPARAYNSANTNDIVTIGSLASNPNVVHTTGSEEIYGSKKFIDMMYIGTYGQFYSEINTGVAKNTVIATYNNANNGSLAYFSISMQDDGTALLRLTKYLNGAWTSVTVATL